MFFSMLLMLLPLMSLVIRVSHNRLWKRLTDKNMMKLDFRLKAGFTTYVIAKMGKMNVLQ